MGIFSSIKDAIFGKDEPEAPAAPAAPHAPAAPTAPHPGSSGGSFVTRALGSVNVVKKLDGMPGADKLNWRTSIADLMQLVGLDPSYANRKELAHELGDADYSGKAEENIWLHRQVMNKLAANGGEVPADLRD